MKRVKISFIALSIFLSVNALAQEYATIYLYRQKKIISAGVSFKAYLNKLEIGQIHNGGRLEYKYYKEGKVDIMCGVFSEYGGMDRYTDNITLDIKKGQVYYIRGEGKSIELVNEFVGKSEFERNQDFRGSVVMNDNKPWGEVNKESSSTSSSSSSSSYEPQIILLSPTVEGEEITVTEESLKVSGYSKATANIKKVTINGDLQTSDDLGNFSTHVKLKEGMNRITIEMVDMNDEVGKKTFNVLHVVNDVASNNEKTNKVTYRGSDPFKGTNVANVAKELKTGKYYALFVGIDKYTGTWTPLKNAVNDAKALENLCKTQYRFDVIRNLYDGQATRENIIKEMEWLVANVKSNDNVLIYYSGHGEFKKELNKGYWVPSDAKSASTSQFISNSEIQTFLSGIPSKHTLLVSDACFSGDIFRGTVASVPFENSDKYYIKTYENKSRQAISSGGIEPVMDGGKDGHSVFAYYMLQALKGNNGKYFDATQLFGKIKIPVVNNSDQTPSFNPIKNTGDEGGNFIFIKK
ncbi:MAG: caspase family protein [Sphingobacteriaceae bacterium]|nr:caspase family protein [Sphingobacteriaceae bacterium]